VRPSSLVTDVIRPPPRLESEPTAPGPDPSAPITGLAQLVDGVFEPWAIPCGRGRAASTAYIAACLAGMARGARRGLDELIARGGDVARCASMVKCLLASRRSSLDGAIAELGRAIASIRGTAAAHRPMACLARFVEQVRNPLEELEGGAFEMTFPMPRSTIDPYLADGAGAGWRSGRRTVRISKEEIFTPRTAHSILALGMDRALDEAGKKTGLSYGPGPETIGTMLYGEPVRVERIDLALEPSIGLAPITALLRELEARGGALAVWRGADDDACRVDSVLDWGSPSIDGAPIAAEDLARCAMNRDEDGTPGSFLLDPSAMARGLRGIHAVLERRASRFAPDVLALARAAEAVKPRDRVNAAYRATVRDLAAGAWSFLLSKLVLVPARDGAGLLCSSFPRATPRGEAIASASAGDGLYFVPLACLARGRQVTPEGRVRSAGIAEPFVAVDGIEAILPKRRLR
jgi:hypothetical protein